MVGTDKGGHVRSFSVNQYDIENIPTRCNERYDVLINVFELQQQLRSIWPKKKRLMIELANEENEKGIMGVCPLRELAHFDVGRSFMTDSLHNIYIGVFVRKIYIDYLFADIFF